MKLKTITIDLAKNVFQVCGVNEHIKPLTIGVRTTLNYLFPPSELTTWWHMFGSNEQDIAKWMNTATSALEGEKTN